MRFAYGQSHHDESLQESALALLEQLPAERNFILRQWQQCGISVDNAADSQALIQLKRNYCDRHDCLRCRFGHEYLKAPIKKDLSPELSTLASLTFVTTRQFKQA